MSEEAEMDAALDGVFGDDGNTEQPEEEQLELEELDGEQGDGDEPEGGEDDTHGHMGYEEFIENGGNPDDYRGKNAFDKQYELQETNKEIRKNVREMKALVQSTVDASTKMQTEAYERGRQELQQQLDDAYAEGDVDAIKETQGQIDDLAPAPKAVQQVNPLHAEYFGNNPLLDQSSDQFDPEFRSEFEANYNARLDAQGGNGRLTERAIKYHMAEAMKATKPMFPEKFTSIRNKRGATTTTQRRATTQRSSKKSNADRINVGNSHNADDSNAGDDIYAMLKEMDPDAAKTFKKNMQGGR